MVTNIACTFTIYFRWRFQFISFTNAVASINTSSLLLFSFGYRRIILWKNQLIFIAAFGTGKCRNSMIREICVLEMAVCLHQIFNSIWFQISSFINSGNDWVWFDRIYCGTMEMELICTEIMSQPLSFELVLCYSSTLITTTGKSSTDKQGQDYF